MKGSLTDSGVTSCVSMFDCDDILAF
jgi:hypothetical protein